MAEPSRAPVIPPQRAYVSWGDLIPDVILLGVGIEALVLSLILDVSFHCHDQFSRSGAVAVLTSGILGYRSLTKHYAKFFHASQTPERPILLTSLNQSIIDYCTLALSIVGTMVWAYGDKLFGVTCR